MIKALDFLFKEGNRFLPHIPDQFSENEKPITSKEQALDIGVPLDVWNTNKDQIVHQLTLLEIQLNNLEMYETQAAKWGDALIPAIINNNLKDTNNKLSFIVNDLMKIFSGIYNSPMILPIKE